MSNGTDRFFYFHKGVDKRAGNAYIGDKQITTGPSGPNKRRAGVKVETMRGLREMFLNAEAEDEGLHGALIVIAKTIQEMSTDCKAFGDTLSADEYHAVAERVMRVALEERKNEKPTQEELGQMVKKAYG